MAALLEKLKQQMVKEVESRMGPLLQEVRKMNQDLSTKLDQTNKLLEEIRDHQKSQ